MPDSIDKKALRILFKKFWSSTGWQDTKLTTEEHRYAYSKGFLFEKLNIDHDGVLLALDKVIQSINPKDVVTAFISSLVTKRLDVRSALSSYAVARSLRPHKFKSGYGKSCFVCGSYKNKEAHDLNVLNFERFKWGGVRHLDPIYQLFDLSEFLKNSEPKTNDVNEGIELLKNSLTELKTCHSAKLSDSVKYLSNFPGNKEEKRKFVELLGYLGVLNVPKYRPFYEEYAECGNRENSNYSKSDWSFPADLWIPANGLNPKAINYWFSKYLAE